MAFADTQKLIVDLSLTGNFGSGIQAAKRDLSGLSAPLISAGSAAGKFGGALSHAGSQLKNLITGPLGILGLGGGLLGFAGAVESSLHKTSEFGLALEKLTGLTGESAQSMGELILVTEKYGIDSDRLAQIVGFTEKTLGRLDPTMSDAASSTDKLHKAQEAVTKASEKLQIAQLKLHETENKRKVSASALASAEARVKDAELGLSDAHARLNAIQAGGSLSKLLELQKQYGVVLTDAKGKTLDFSTVLGHVADYYTSNAAASDKAALAAKVFGRGYATLIPVLQLGSVGINKAKQAIDDMGLSLGTDSQGALEAYKSSLRSLGESVDILQIQIGLALAPAITDLANNITIFLEHGGAKQIVGFFKDGAKFAQGMGKVIQSDVIPIFKGITDAWGSVDPGLRDLIIKGFVAGKVSKFLFDFGPLDIAKGLAPALLGALGKAGIGKAFVQPVFVTNQVLPGAGGLAGGGGGVLAAAKNVLFLSAAAAIAAKAVDLYANNLVPLNQHIAGQTQTIMDATNSYSLAQKSLADLQKASDGTAQGIAELDHPFYLLYGDQKKALEASKAAIDAEIAHRRSLATDERAQAVDEAQQHNNLSLAFDRLEGAANPMARALTGATAAADRLAHKFDATKSLNEILKGIQERSAAKFGGTGLGAEAVRATFGRDLIKIGDRILHGTVVTSSGLTRLQHLQAVAVANKDWGVARKLGADISAMKLRLAATTAGAGREAAEAIRRKRLSVTVNNTTNITATISARTLISRVNQVSRYGTVAI